MPNTRNDRVIPKSSKRTEKRRVLAGTSGQGQPWVWDVVDGLDVATEQVSPARRWCRHLDWSPDGTMLVVGGKGLGRVILFHLKSRSITQERVLSPEKSPEKLRLVAGLFLEVTKVRFLDGGRKIAWKCACGDGLEVYDFRDNRKWRFAPAQGLAWGWANGDFYVLEDKGMIASVDADAVRFWKAPFCEGK